MRKIILFLITSIGMIACNNDDNTATNVDFVTLDCGWTSANNYEETTPYIINSEEQWQNFLSLTNNESEFEDINFLDATILAVVDKLRPDDNHRILISQISETPTTINVVVKSTRNEGMAIQQPITPYCIVKTNKINKPISWQYINN